MQDPKTSPKIAIWAPSHNFVGLYLRNYGMYRQSEKNLLSSNISSTCPCNMVNFGPLAAEILSLVWGTPGNFNWFRVLAALLHGTLVVGVSQTAALNRGRHLYSAGRPSRWAFAHISSFEFCIYVCKTDVEYDHGDPTTGKVIDLSKVTFHVPHMQYCVHLAVEREMCAVGRRLW